MEKEFVNKIIGQPSDFDAFIKREGLLIPYDKLSIVYGNTPVGYHSTDPSGKIILINDVELKWLGYTREEVVKKMTWQDLCTTQSYDRFQEHYKALVEEGHLLDLFMECVTKTGQLYPVVVNAIAVYDEKGDFVMARTTVVQIIEQKRLEAELRKKNQELESLNKQLYELNQEKNRFLGIASHDLQTPLTNIRLLTDKLKLTQQNLTERQRYWVEDIQVSIEQMSHMIYSLLSVNRIEQGANMPLLESVNLANFLSHILGRFQVIANRKHIGLRFECDSDEAWVKADPQYLTEIVENLLSNAIKFSPAGHDVRVRVSHAESHVQLSVSDEGKGIKPDEMPLLFGKFQKLSTRPTAGESSTGLGLSIVKDHAEKIGATVSCQSEYGKGATFSVMFHSI